MCVIVYTDLSVVVFGGRTFVCYSAVPSTHGPLREGGWATPTLVPTPRVDVQTVSGSHDPQVMSCDSHMIVSFIYVNHCIVYCVCVCRFSAFGDIFSEAVKRGLKAIQVCVFAKS